MTTVLSTADYGDQP